MQSKLAVFAKLYADVRGAMAIIAALALPAVIGAAGLAVDLNRGYDQRIENQRVADAAALGAALAFSEKADPTLLTPVASDIARANGLSGVQVRAELLPDFPAKNTNSVRVTVTRTLPFTLARVVGVAGSFDVSASSVATLDSDDGLADPCILALSGDSDAISVGGGASISAPQCAVSAVGGISNNGTLIEAKNIISGAGAITNNWGTLRSDLLRYATAFNNPSWNGNVPPADKRVQAATPITDPLGDNAELVAARSQLGHFTAPNMAGDPLTPSKSSWNGSNGWKDWTFGWSPTSTTTPYRGSDANYVVTSDGSDLHIKNLSVPGGTVVFRGSRDIYVAGDLTTGGGGTLRFEGPVRLFVSGRMNVSGGSISFSAETMSGPVTQSVLTVASGLTMSGGAKAVFGAGTYRINGGFTGSSNGVTFGDIDLWIGSGSASFSGTNRIGNGDVRINAPLQLSGGTSLRAGNGKHMFSSLNIGGGSWMWLGNGDLDVAGGIFVGGGSELNSGNGDYRIGRPASGPAIRLDGSAHFFMGDGQFSTNGDIVTSGGSALVFGKTLNHYINGRMEIAGSVLFGTSRYTVNGNFKNGTGGTKWPIASYMSGVTYGNTAEGESVSGYDMAGIDVTFILAGTLDLSGGAKTKLVAASTGVSGGAIADILIDSLSASATTWSGGSANLFVGAVHLPNSTLTLSGGNTTLSDGRCFMLITGKLNASGGAAAGTACTSITEGAGNGGAASIGLIR
ncbi:hypothetical protein GCM10011329_02280 [Stakelama pacifica]|nr:hypothetical protein GCM10011329_02280 [Stakelama pacifica]